MNKTTIILIEPQQPDNVAAIARVMASFGFKELILVNPLLNVKDIRPEVSRGGTSIIDNMKVYDNMNKVREEHNILFGTTAKTSLGRNYNKNHTDIEGLKELLKEHSGKIGIVFGREDRGLTNEELELCDISLRIETSNEQRALNLSHATAIILHSISKIERKEKEREISIENKERIIKEIKELYEISSNKNNTYIEKRKQTHGIVWRKILTNPMLNDMHGTAVLGLLNEIRKAIEKENKK